ncbi:MAG: ribose 5-phosphate isomerase B [Candidatus Electryonea clarkiae]|nr:ribose 5-phosphate isomerase B [Candidatus Electryonea clarkiae]MDP8287243.1 ribose 5-phosphate isomerase B [Candidatus Electryonea clarkiae]
MKIVVAADHGGVDLKDQILIHLQKAGHEVTDLGTYSSESVDYPDYALEASIKVASGEMECGILFCGTGIGMSIAANKIAGIYCAKVNSEEEGKLAAEHNLANMLALGCRMIDPETAWSAVKAWLETPHGGERHQRRVGKIAAIEKRNHENI